MTKKPMNRTARTVAHSPTDDELLRQIHESLAADALDTNIPLDLDAHARVLGVDPDDIRQRAARIAGNARRALRASWQDDARHRLRRARELLADGLLQVEPRAEGAPAGSTSSLPSGTELASLDRAAMLAFLLDHAHASAGSHVHAMFRSCAPEAFSDEELRELVAEVNLLLALEKHDAR